MILIAYEKKNHSHDRWCGIWVFCMLDFILFFVSDKLLVSTTWAVGQQFNRFILYIKFSRWTMIALMFNFIQIFKFATFSNLNDYNTF